MTTDNPEDKRINEKKENGQNKVYLVLSEEERGKGYVRPLRKSYIHERCGTMTSMGFKIAETYARNPTFYSHTFCVHCKEHLPVEEFVWVGTQEKVGS